MIGDQIQSFHLAEDSPGISSNENQIPENIKCSRFPLLFKRNTHKSTEHNPDGNCRLNKIHYRLQTTNAGLWKQLRVGALRGCFVGLSAVAIEGEGESLSWREVNCKTVSALRRFETATTDTERRISVREAIEQIGHKLFLVRKAALRKGMSNFEETEAIRSIEREFSVLSIFFCQCEEAGESPMIVRA